MGKYCILLLLLLAFTGHSKLNNNQDLDDLLKRNKNGYLSRPYTESDLLIITKYIYKNYEFEYNINLINDVLNNRSGNISDSLVCKLLQLRASNYSLSGDYNSMKNDYLSILSFDNKVNIHDFDLTIGLAESFCYLKDYKTAKMWLDRGLEAYEIRKDSLSIAYIYLIYGDIYFNESEKIKSINSYRKSASFCENQDCLFLPELYSSMLNFYLSIDDLKKAKEIIELQILFFNNNDSYFTLRIQSKIDLANLYYDLNDIDSAKYEFVESLEMSVENNYRFGVAESKVGIARFEKESENYSLALEYLNEALDYFDTIRYPNRVANIGLLKSEIYLLKVDYLLAEEEVNKVLLMKTIDHKDLYFFKAYNILYKLNIKKENYKKAIEYSILCNELKDRITYIADEKEYVKDELKYQYKQEFLLDSIRDSKNKELYEEQIKSEKEKADQQLYFIISLFILGLIVFYIRISYVKKHNEIKLQEVENKLLQTQLKPHFISNTLSAIQGYILNNEPVKASDYLSDYSLLMREVLNMSNSKYISIKEDIALLNQFLHLESIRFEKAFEYNIEANSLELENILIPPMLSQPFVENAINHGVLNDSFGVIEVSYFLLNQSQIKIVIKDNGVGIKDNGVGIKDNKLHSLDIIKKRLKIIEETTKIKSMFKIFPDENGNKGTISEVIVHHKKKW